MIGYGPIASFPIAGTSFASGFQAAWAIAATITIVGGNQT